MCSQKKMSAVSHKCVLLGDSNVGKSCLVVRFARGEFFDYQVRPVAPWLSLRAGRRRALSAALRSSPLSRVAQTKMHP